MRKLVALLLCVVMLSASARVIKMPLAKNALSHEFIESVELTDDSTTFTIAMFHLPGYWCSLDTLALRGKVSGKEYPLLGVKDYTFNEKKTMPESGVWRFKVSFPPLDDRDSIVDLVENNSLSGFYDVRLSPNPPAGKIHTRIEGIYPGKEKALVIEDASASSHDAVRKVWIPVEEDGHFSYDMYSDDVKGLVITEKDMYLKGIFRLPRMLSENTVITVSYEAEEDGRYTPKISAPAGTLTHELNEIETYAMDLWDNAPVVHRRDSLEKAKKYYSPELYRLMELYEKHPEQKDSIGELVNELWKQGKARSKEGQLAEEAVEKFGTVDLQNLKIAKAVEKRSFAGLFTLVHASWYTKDTAPITAAWREYYADLFPGHPYTERLKMLSETTDPVPGNKFVDFSAPDLQGEVHRVSDLVKGHPALIDLWATWCMPCRRTAISMKPVYEKYADKGFVIVGVGANESLDKIKLAAEKDNYPWTVLAEVAGKNGIWAKYRCSNAGGTSVLVDAGGTIVSVYPKAEEVEKYLEEYYGNSGNAKK